jgi:3-phenylpropionate/cinnamic acid dioxygenase small subunit
VTSAADHAAIVQQMYRYARATDWFEVERHRDVFMAECVFASPHSGDMHGIDAVVEWMNDVLPRFEATQHLIGNITIEFLDDDHATAVSYVQAWHRHLDPAKADVVLWGEYHDRWVRAADNWRIAERRVLEAGIEPRRFGGAPNPRRQKVVPPGPHPVR